MGHPFKARPRNQTSISYIRLDFKRLFMAKLWQSPALPAPQEDLHFSTGRIMQSVQTIVLPGKTMTRPAEYTRHAIIRAAVALFAEKGFEGTGVRDIVA
jgi:hypothetical protein